MTTLDKFFSLIDILEKKGPLPRKELLGETGMDKSTLHRFLTEMEKEGFVSLHTVTNRVHLGYRFLTLAAAVKRNLRITELARPVMRELREITGETVHLAEFDGSKLYYIDKIESDHTIRMHSKIGAEIPFHSTALGKAVLAHQDFSFIGDFLARCAFQQRTPRTIDSPELLLSELEKVKKNGYALDREEDNEGICCLAAPVFDDAGLVRYAISVSAVASRMSLEGLLAFREKIVGAAGDISQTLGAVM
jgi:IclR family acetate operon transcriptional repressor